MTSWLVRQPHCVARLDLTLSWHLEWWDRKNIMMRCLKNAESGCNLSLIVCLQCCCIPWFELGCIGCYGMVLGTGNSIVGEPS